jgi:DNA-3-methyladenine glycosylase I
MLAYHDREWGVPQHGERQLFELLTLEGAQAGLSWTTILRRRDGYRRAFLDFDADRVAGFGEADLERLLEDGTIIRNRQKLTSTIENARRIVALRQEGSSLDELLWSFVGGQPIVHGYLGLEDLPAQTGESLAMSKALRKRGFGFVGPTICYALMQAAGLVNDHVIGCFRYAELAG